MLFRGIDHFVICYHLHYRNIVSLVGLDFYYKNKLHTNYTLMIALIYKGVYMNHSSTSKDFGFDETQDCESHSVSVV